MSALADFLSVVLRQSQALQDTVWADSEALRYAGAVWKQRHRPATPEELAEQERLWRLEVEDDRPFVPFDAEEYLRPRVYQHRGERFENPPQITEDDVLRYDFRHGMGVANGVSRTAQLFAAFNAESDNGFSRPHMLMRKALSEATANGTAGTVAPLLRAAYDAHEALLNAARRAEDAGDRQISGEVFVRHCEAVNPLMLFLPPDEATAVKAEPADNEAEAMGRLLAMMDDNAPRMLAIADSRELTASDKMAEICQIDARFYGVMPPRWAIILKVTERAIRKTRFWSIDRPKLIGDAEERFRELNPGGNLPEWMKVDKP